MFYCPACGGAVLTTASSHYCVVCEWGEARQCLTLDDVDGLVYPGAHYIPEYSAA